MNIETMFPVFEGYHHFRAHSFVWISVWGRMPAVPVARSLHFI